MTVAIRLEGRKSTPATAKTSSLACDLVPTNDKDSQFLSEITTEREPPRKLVSGSWYSGRLEGLMEVRRRQSHLDRGMMVECMSLRTAKG